MSVGALRQESPAGTDLYRTESRIPLEHDIETAAPTPVDPRGPSPFAFRFLSPVTSTGGVLPAVIEYDEETQTSTYDDLPPGVFMTKNPPTTYSTTEATETTPEQMDAKDDPGPSDD